jgi:polyisoprenoid-binding protein YceI
MRNRYATSILLSACCFMSTLAASAGPITFVVDDSKNSSGSRDSVSFTSDAPIELIVGHTNKITGKINIDETLDLSKKPLEAQFAVDLASIDTGIELRNEHMRDNFLQTKQYPQATFKLKSLGKPVALKPGQKTRIDASGDFTIHGKTVTKNVPVFVTWFKKCQATEQKKPGCDLLQISAEFPVAFKDHGIPRPEIVFQKLSDTVIVKVGATGYYQLADAKASASASPVQASAKTKSSTKSAK